MANVSELTNTEAKVLSDQPEFEEIWSGPFRWFPEASIAVGEAGALNQLNRRLGAQRIFSFFKRR